jgi:hypothetical protein
MSGGDGVVQIHPTESLAKAEIKQRSIEFTAPKSFHNALASDLGQSAFVHRDVRSPIHLAHWL